MKLIVDTITDEAPGIRSFRLVQPDGAPLPAYEAGAHVDITAPGGVMRQYSLCGDPADTRAYLVAVKLEPQSRGGSLSLHADVKAGDALEVGMPRNLFALAADAPEHLLFGAGIGITPLLAMTYALRDRGERHTLHYFVRSPEYAAFAPLLAREPFASHVRLHAGVEPDALDAALRAALAAAQTGSQAHVYTCGPAPFMDKVVTSARAMGHAEDAVHLEHFQAEPVSNAGADRPFDIKLAQSGQVLAVPAGVAIVEVLARAGIAIDTSCREGICGTCVVPVLEGEPEHRDHCLSKKEKAANDQICACVSRARSSQLMLDL